MRMHEQWRFHCTSQSGWQTPLSEHVYCVANTFKMTEGVEQRICIKFCVKLEHSSAKATRRIQKAAAVGSLVIGSFITTVSTLTYHFSCRVFFWQNVRSPRWLRPPTAQIWRPATFGFFKTEITFERQEISDRWCDSGKYDGAADGNWENSVRS